MRTLQRPVPAGDDGAAAPARPAGRRPTVVAAVVAIVIAVAAGLVGRQVAVAEPTGRTTHVTVSMHHMSYSQPSIQVPAGNRLAITLRSDNEDMGGSGNPSPEGVT